MTDTRTMQAPRAPQIRLQGILLTLVIGAIFAAGIYVQHTVLLNHDVGWVIRSALWLLEGKRFGVDIVEPNPPLIWYVSLPAAALAHWNLLTEVDAIRLLTWLICALSVVVSYRLLGALRRADRVLDAHVVLVAFVVAICILPKGIFAQREHLTVALAFPYCLLAAARLEHGAGVSNRFAILVGVMAGIGFAFKPYLLAVPLLVELVFIGSTRRFTSIFRPEIWAMGVTGLAYVVSIPLLNPEYLKSVVPLARTIYWAFENMPLAVLRSRLIVACEPALAAAVLLFLSRSVNKYHLVLGAALAGYAISYWLQFKGYEYHRYPLTASALILLAVASVSAWRGLAALRTSLPPWLTRAIQISVAAIGVVYFSQALAETRQWYQSANARDGSIGAARMRLVKLVDDLAGAQQPAYLYAFSTHPFPGFPTVNYTHLEWASRTNSQFVIPALLKRSDRKAPKDQRRLDEAIAYQRQIVLEDFQRHEPKVVLLDAARGRHAIGGRKYDDIAFFCEDPRFAAIWTHYSEVPNTNLLGLQVRVFVRDSVTAKELRP